MRQRWIAFFCSLGIAACGITLMIVKPNKNLVVDEMPKDIVTRHPVTEEMKKAAAALERKPVQQFREVDSEGVPFELGDLKSGTPSILVFVKNECPCSIEAQPIFNAMARAYGGDAKFFCIMDAGQRDADAFGTLEKVPFPVVCDADESIIKAFDIQASASFALIDGNGQIARIWPGYSQTDLRQANVLLGTLAKCGPKEFDDSKAPKELTAGCTFEWTTKK